MRPTWTTKEKISQKSSDRLLEIPLVKEHLGLSFLNTRCMLQNVVSIPERYGKWYTKHLSFKDRPSECFTVRAIGIS
ncbi:hypothetical protein GGU10DRAFT_34188 [Lentinula aff. detonsa]|uniref:Uncharacterized protein n=1 Tax=Lentinula aff. detonsa TaxID=2804958 RepID=A0AA38NIN7_9AGAR|nr:hypothetical protein GGU10DRAFT_34188 [Lentinula aff. detonsa]